MIQITEENCISFLKEKFPRFIPYWNSFVDYWGLGQGITIKMLPFGEYAVDVIKSKDEIEMKKLFDYVEFLICNGDDSVQTAMTTSFLEHLMGKDPHEIQFTTFVKYLGKKSIEYCKAWDKFTGVKTKGLWEDEA